MKDYKEDNSIEEFTEEVLGEVEDAVEVEVLIDEVLEDVSKSEKRKVKVFFYNMVRRAVMIVALGVYMYSVYSLSNIYLDYNHSASVYNDVHAMFHTQTDAEQQPAGGFLNWNFGKEDKKKWVWNYDTLLSVNEDSVGWIALEGTKIHYPIVQGTDNDYYLHHTIDRAYNFAGTVFVDYRYPLGMDSNYSIIYGHYMKDGTMFAYLDPFRNQDYGNEHNVFDIYIKDKHYHYYVFSVYITKGEETPDSPYQFNLNPVEYDFTEEQEKIFEMTEAERKAYRDSLSASERIMYDHDVNIVKSRIAIEEKRIERFEAFIKKIRNKSKYVMESNEYIDDITVDDHILTISTCWSVSENTRLIIHMVRGEEVNDKMIDPDTKQGENE